MNETQYTTRAIAFIDILGFREIIAALDAAEASELWESVINSVQELAAWEDVSRTETSKDYFGGREVTAFSDCAVMSYPINAPGLVKLILDSGILTLTMLAKGRLSRGAITVGSLYHSGRTVFGQGMIDAYDLERTSAIYPRLLVSDVAARMFFDEHKGSQIDVSSTAIRQDKDGMWFVPILDYGWPGGERVRMRLEPELVATARHCIEEGLDKYRGQPRKYAKYDWLARYFNESIADYPEPRPQQIRI